jgi:hypothetical protein
MVITTPLSPVNSLMPTLSWSSGGGGGNGNYRVKFNDTDLSTGATPVNGATSYTSSSALVEGNNTLYVQEQDAAGNWSQSSSRTIYCVNAGQMGSSPSSNTHPFQGLGIVVSSTGTPYVWVRGDPSAISASDEIKAYNGSSWQSTGFTDVPQSGSGTIRINPLTGLPSFSYTESDSGTFHLVNYSGSTWNELRSFQNRRVSTFDYDASGQPIAADYFNFDTLKTWKYTGAGYWNNGFPGDAPDFGTAQDRIQLLMDPSDNPYVYYKSSYNTNSFNLRTFKGTSWSSVSDNGIPNRNLFGIRLGINKNGKLYALASDSPDGTSVKASVYLYNGSSKWNFVGSRFPFDVNLATEALAIAFNSAGDPVVAMTEPGKVSVWSYNGQGTWLKMGSAATSEEISDISLAIGPNDIAYVAFGGTVKVFKFGFDP